MLLTTICAFSQSNQTLKGDVNEDGIVDVADISSIIDIMASGEITLKTYYWYVGVIKPTDPTNSEQNSGLNKWTSLGTTLPTTNIKVAKADSIYADHTWYIAAPTDANFTLYNATNVASDEATWNKTTFNVGSVSYTLWTSKDQSWQAVEYLHNEVNTKYKWYSGTTEPTANNLALIYTGSSAAKPTWTLCDQQSFAATNNTGSDCYIYYCYPTTWNVIFYASGTNVMLLADVSTFTLNGIDYTVKRTGRPRPDGETLYLSAIIRE